MSSILDDVANYLAAQGAGTAGTDVFSDRYPADPDNIVSVLSTTGNQTPDKNIAALRYPAIQVMVRNQDYDAAMAKCETVRTALHAKIGLQLANFYLMRCHLRFEFQSLGQDGNGRFEFSATFDTEAR